MSLSIEALRRRLSACMNLDARRLSSRLHGVKKLPEAKQGQVLETIAAELDAAQARYQSRLAGVPRVTYPDNLPVSQKQGEIAKAIEEHQVVIIAGETGSGKTTQIPKICLALGRGVKGFIGHTQPRRLAARTVAARIAEEMESELGHYVGYKVRFTDQVSEQTHIKLMTDGILLAEIQNDRMLTQYDTIIIDEAHERSLNIDFILGYLKQLLPKRPDLKVIITSATIDPQRFSRHFNKAPVIEVSGRTYPVEVRYRPLVSDKSEGLEERDELQGIFDAVEELAREGLGDILIFMNGEREIRDTADALRKLNLRDTEVLPLYARLSNAEQNKVFQQHAGRRIVLATNVAETSLTVPGIRYVIDPGTARISRYSWRTKVQRLPIEPVSQASANQRKGRCGRVADGICIRLYSEEDFNSRPAFTDPEILRTNLASVILQMLALGLGNMEAFPFVEPPESRHIKDGLTLLKELEAVRELPATGDREAKLQLTEIGRQLSRIPLDPRLAKMVISAAQTGCLSEVMVITAALSIQDPRERPMEKKQAADEQHRRFEDKDSDFLAFVNLWNYLKEQQDALGSNPFRRMCQKEFLSYLRVREWQDIHFQLRQTVKELGFKANHEPADFKTVHCALLTGLLSHIGNKDLEKPEFLGARSGRFHLFPASGLFKKPPKWVMAAELVETSRLYARINAKIEPEWVEPLAGHLIKLHHSDPHWSKKNGAVMAKEKVTLYGLTLVNERTINFSRIDPALCRELFIRRALVEGDFETRHRFFSDNRKLLAEVEALEHKSRRRDILVDDEDLFRFYDARLPEDVISARHFDKWWKEAQKQDPELLNFEKEMLMKGDAAHISDLDYPNFWQQGRLKLKLTYQFEPGEAADGVTLHIPLPLLNQVEVKGFEWLIPGLRHELLVALIKSMPKPMRKNFVPAPNYADALLASINPEQGPLLDEMERQLRRMTGVTVPRESWDWAAVPDHLKLTFRVVDDKHKKVAEGKDLEALKESLRGKVQETLSQVADDDIEQSGLTLWSFGELPQEYSQKRGGFEVKAYPALVDQKDSVAIQLVESPVVQQQLMWAGQRRLVLLNVPSPIKYLQEKLPNKAKLGLYFNPFGKVAELIDDCIACGCDKLIEQHGGMAWDEAGFEALKEYVRAELNDAVVEVAKQVEAVLTLSHEIKKRLKGKMQLDTAFAMSDIQQQLGNLIHKGFVTETGWQRLPDLLRYLRAIERRLEKLAIDPNRDRVYMLKVHSVESEYKALLAKIPKSQLIPTEVANIRWMIEELRVSFFAQQLGTPYPISDKRVQSAIAQC
ncbi:ATP-dependent RNA helicase HrpA [Aeromonas caviae]|uniref:ATP-dependent RNA helicase HrpA n=1 Tax=Aeromonas caviae TaxID=648 RepID=UPI000536F860|nr:ATP-dependent RNA helicase HrpA [Aeromonas caviae]AUU20991.1 ATP-dependent RNA helicase HrpA [Aeromonas caviae]QOK17562.1 ATP-dependent RNA helicase HrpA [Aeromonas caviae]